MLGRHDDALNDCDAAVELEPGLAKVHNRSARLRLALGRRTKRDEASSVRATLLRKPWKRRGPR